ncbi:MAG: hypothetical protein ABW217_12750 [Polyangiaceae bacterium]
MSSVEPLLRGSATAFERQLLAAVRGERPSARQRRRMLRGLGLSSGFALWAATAPAVVPSAPGKLALGLGAAAIVSLAVVPLVRERAAARNAAVPALPVSAAAVGRAASPAEHVVEPLTDVSESATDSAEAAVANAEGASAPDGTGELRAQIDLLDAVKRAVNRKDGAEAMALLARFDERFPRGVLRSEASTLRRAASRL